MNAKNKTQIAALSKTIQAAWSVQVEMDKAVAEVNKVMKKYDYYRQLHDSACGHAVGQTIHDATDNMTNEAARIRDGLELMRALRTKLEN